MIRLQCGVTNNDWGKPASTSIVYEFARASSTLQERDIEIQKTFAELWIGTHPLVPSYVYGKGQTLSAALGEANDSSCALSPVSARHSLPFLLKVLSISKALCIQAHPGEELAAQLHLEDKIAYPDNNPKPEMVIALTKFNALCGFRPLSSILQLLTEVSPLRRLMETSFIRRLRTYNDGKEQEITLESNFMRDILTTLLNTSPEKISHEVGNLHNFAKRSITTQNETTLDVDTAKLIVELYRQYPRDIGLFIALLMNRVSLDPGEALFIPAGQLHAYINGDVIECMTPSANVARAALTQKVRDIPNLLRMVDCVPQPPQRVIPQAYNYGISPNVCFSLHKDLQYRHLAADFRVLFIKLDGERKEVVVNGTGGCMIYLCTQGHGSIQSDSEVEELKRGYVFYVPRNAMVIFRRHMENTLELYAAFSEEKSSYTEDC